METNLGGPAPPPERMLRLRWAGAPAALLSSSGRVTGKVPGWRTQAAAEFAELVRNLELASGIGLRQVVCDAYSVLESATAAYLREGGRFVDRRPRLSELIGTYEADLQLPHNDSLLLQHMYIPMRHGVSHRRLLPYKNYVEDFVQLCGQCLERFGVEMPKSEGK